MPLRRSKDYEDGGRHCLISYSLCRDLPGIL